MFDARVELDSISALGHRITTVVARYPRFIHCEVLTHRAFARNAASSRALPFGVMLKNATFAPLFWGGRKAGMQQGEQLEGKDRSGCIQEWEKARNSAIRHARQLDALGLHKSICNRILEPFSWITTIITATEWANFFRLRCHPDAEPHFQKIACMIRDAIEASTPVQRTFHLPFVTEAELGSMGLGELAKLSTARSARVSYLNHDGKVDAASDIKLFDKLASGSGFGHWSPMEHPATAQTDVPTYSGPFYGWTQYRKSFANENLRGHVDAYQQFQQEQSVAEDPSLPAG